LTGASAPEGTETGQFTGDTIMAEDHKVRNGHDAGVSPPSLPSGERTPRMRRDMEEEESGGRSNGVWKRTCLFLLGGTGMLLLGWLVQPRYQSREVKPEAERILFPELTDVQKAASLEVVKYDEELATLQPFKVVQTGGVWVLPSHQNYPADAKDHLAAAATELVDLESLDVVTTTAADHETYGVIEPDPDKIKPGMTGVGEMIEIRDAGGNKLARLVVGKEDKRSGGSAEGGKKLRFVRKAGQDPVYRVEIDTSKFTTRFDDWIEKDLLKLSPWDVRRAVLDDYSLGAVESGGRIRVEQNRKDRIEVAYDDKDQQWTLARLEAFGGGAEAKVETLAEGEELATARLNDLRNALGDLKIVDVVRKPAGLSAELKAEEKFTADEEAVRSMQQRGFLPLKSGDILSTDGETIIGMKDGVEYVLRFGAGTSLGNGTGGDVPADESTGRYLLVMARFNENLLEKPVLEAVPGDAPAVDGDAADEAAKPAGEGDAADQLKAADEAEAKAQAALEARRAVERENRRRQDDYDTKVKAAQRRVRDLNARFADWYYIVPAKEYAKIHLDRGAIVQPKGSGAADTAPAGGGLPFGAGGSGPSGLPRTRPAPTAPPETPAATATPSAAAPEAPPAPEAPAAPEDATPAAADPAAVPNDPAAPEAPVDAPVPPSSPEPGPTAGS
jgi:hypothetical protein